MKRILIVNMHYKTGGVRKSFENLVNFYSKDNSVDIQFFLDPQTSIDFLKNHNTTVLKPLFLLDTYYSSKTDIDKKSFRLLRYFLKVIMRLFRYIWGSEKLIQFIINRYPSSKEYDVAIAFSHDIRINGVFSGGCNYFVSHQVKAKKKYAWIHGEVENIGLDYEAAIKTYSSFDKVINVSRACNDSFQILSKGQIKSEFIYNLFDLNEIYKKSSEPVDDYVSNMFTFVTVARIHPVKRIDKLLAVSKNLYDKGYSFQWYVVGGGNLLESYKQEATQLGIDRVVHFVGNQSNPYKFISNANVFVLLSDSESFSIVINEALIIGVPVVTTNFPAAYESVHDGVNGFIVDKSFDAMNECLEFCLKNKAHIENMKRIIGNESWGEKLVNDSENKLLGLIS